VLLTFMRIALPLAFFMCCYDPARLASPVLHLAHLGGLSFLCGEVWMLRERVKELERMEKR
jgi:hypothetical protein